MTKKKITTTAAKPKRTRTPTKEALALAQSLRPRGGHLPLALIADKLATRYRYSRERPVRVKPDSLADDLDLSLPQVKRAMADLGDAGLISFINQTRHKTNKTFGGSLYEVRKLAQRLDEIRFYMQPPPRPRRAPTSRRQRVTVEESMEAARADHRAYLTDRATEAEHVTGGWGVPRYDEELRCEVKAAVREARADAQATQAWILEELEEFAARALAQYEVWNLPGHLRLQDAREQAQYDGPTEEEVEANALDRREWLAFLYTEVPTLAVLGIPGYPELLQQHLPEVYKRLFG